MTLKSSQKQTGSKKHRHFFCFGRAASPDRAKEDEKTSWPNSGRTLVKLKSIGRKTGRAFLWSLFILGLFGALGWIILGIMPDPLAGELQWDYTVTITDRYGLPLREIWPPPMSRKENKLLSEFSPHLVAAVIAAEDKRFWIHPGIDPLATARALVQNLREQKVISGASTITMQLARLSLGLAPGPRSLSRKLRETYLALAIERHHTKAEILALYLNSAPVGGPNVGFQAAAKAWLGKSAYTLSPAEASFLAGLPARPGQPGPFPSPKSLARKNMILKRLQKNGHLTSDELKRALVEPLVLVGAERSFIAPHFTAQVAKTLPALPPKVVTATLDLDLQEKVQRLASLTVQKFKAQGLRQVAVVVLSLPEREVLAYVGSADFFDPEEGQIDGVTTPRQPGSALKPFIYAYGLETKAITASSLINDSETDYVVPGGSYSPRNYSGTVHGPVQARLALASSLNLPAISLTSYLGVKNILEQLKKLGLHSLTESAEHYGLGLALGGGEVTLLELSTAYAALADQGILKPPVLTVGSQWPSGQKSDRLSASVGSDSGRPALGLKVIDPRVTFIISDILSDDPARATGFGPHGPLATPYYSSVKTGTSKNFRDNWCLGYTDGFVIGVWAGNFQNRPMGHVSGITGAGHLWREVADLMAEMRPPITPIIPPGVEAMAICPISGLPAGPDCPNIKMEYFLAETAHGPKCDHNHMNLSAPLQAKGLGAVPVVGLKSHFGFLSPKSGEIYAWDPGLPKEYQSLRASVQSSPDLDELVVFHNGQEIARRKVSGSYKASVPVNLARGRQLLEVAGLKDGREIKSDRAVFTVK